MGQIRVRELILKVGSVFVSGICGPSTKMTAVEDLVDSTDFNFRKPKSVLSRLVFLNACDLLLVGCLVVWLAAVYLVTLVAHLLSPSLPRPPGYG